MKARLQTWFARYGLLLAVVGVLLLTTVVRLRLADAPLERDEGEYAYGGQLILHGTPPYALVYNMKLPGVYYTYALILGVIGETPRAIRIGLTVANITATIFLFFIGWKLVGRYGAAIAAMTFALMSLDQGILGTSAHATHFALVPALAATLILLGRQRRPFNLLCAGLLLGSALLITQQLVFACALAIYVVIRGARPSSVTATDKRRQVLALLVGISLPLLAVVAILATQGVLQRFLYWIVRYGSAYASKVSMAEGALRFAAACHEVARVDWPFWLTGLVGFIEIKRPWWPPETRGTVRGLLLAGFLGMIPGFYFREHYFVLMLPAVALGVAVALLSLERIPQRHATGKIAHALPAAVFLALTSAYLLEVRATLFADTPQRVTRQRYGPNPFAEAAAIGEYIAGHSGINDRILVLGSEPEIYFYANRRSATGYVYGYPLAENQRYRDDMLADMRGEVALNKPAYLVVVNVATSWYDFPDTGPVPPPWVADFVGRCFEPVGIADIVSPERTVFVWGSQAASYTPVSDRTVRTYQRSESADCR